MKKKDHAAMERELPSPTSPTSPTSPPSSPPSPSPPSSVQPIDCNIDKVEDGDVSEAEVNDQPSVTQRGALQ